METLRLGGQRSGFDVLDGVAEPLGVSSYEDDVSAFGGELTGSFEACALGTARDQDSLEELESAWL